ncbi:MAG: hypothetical protein ACP5OG_04215 [Candidatus Nanoarchaeia archaeon]
MITPIFQFPEQYYECEICNEPIAHPICPVCLTTEVEAWLALYPNLKQDLIPALRRGFRNQIKVSTRCIKCSDSAVSICPLCFTIEVFEKLKKLGVDRIILREFLEFFNFDFEHNAYTKEAEILGVV